MRINYEDAQFLVVDYQSRLMPSIERLEDLLKNAHILLRGMEILGVPMLVTQQYPQGLGGTDEKLMEYLGQATFVDKVEFSVFQNEKAREVIEGRHKKCVILCGMEAHICVLQTAIDLKEAGYIPVVVVDAIASRKEKSKEIALYRYQQEGIYCTTTESILFELLKTSKHPAFKEISKLIR